LANADSPDVVGYEYELALERCKEQGIEPVTKLTGYSGSDGVVRVVRQQWRGGSLILTCAHEAWS